MPINSDVTNTYRNLMDTINGGLIMLDAQSNVCISNTWFNQHCEYDFQDKAAVNLYILFPELKEGRIHDAINSTLEFGYPTIVSHLFTPTPFPLYAQKNFEDNRREDRRIEQQVTISRLEQSGDYFCLVQINDVTSAVHRESILATEINERQQIEDALLESDIKHLTIMEEMVDGLIVFSSKGHIDSFNPACEALFGYAESNISGTCVSTLFKGLTNDDNTCGSELQINSRFIGSYNEILGITKDGTMIDVELSISDMKISGKIFYTAIVRDITERKNIDKLKTEFISTVSHELRTPLTSIQGSLGLICGGVIEPSTDKAKELLNIAYSNCDRLVLLINDILDMEKIAAGGLEFEIKAHELRPLLEHCIKDNKSYADAYKVEYRLIADQNNYKAMLDQHRFLQIISNLLSNAAKFSREGEYVDIRLTENRGKLQIQVQDYGDGIPAKFKDTIWNKFTQADASTTRKKGGTGLGLAISRSLVNGMSGDIYFESEEGKGTTFYVTFPLLKT